MNKKEAIEMLELTVGAYLLSGKADDTRCMQWREMLEAIEKDAEPVRHGHWVDHETIEYLANCSVCGYQMDTHAERGYHRYCPYCGAKMEADDER